jgi:hypothetical protein
VFCNNRLHFLPAYLDQYDFSKRIPSRFSMSIHPPFKSSSPPERIANPANATEP